MKYGPHKSSLFDLDANIAAMLVYLLPLLLGFVSDSLSAVAWIIPLLAFIMEKNSSFVTYHAANSLAFYVIDAIIFVISTILGITAVLTSWVSNIAFVGMISIGITGFLFLFIGLIFLVIEIYLFVGKVICAIKAYEYQENYFAIIDRITAFIFNLKR